MKESGFHSKYSCSGVSAQRTPSRGRLRSSDEEAAGLDHGFQKYINSVEPSVQFEDQVWERYLRQP